MFKWVNRCAVWLLLLVSAQSFAINSQDPYLLVKEAAGKTFTVRSRMLLRLSKIRIICGRLFAKSYYLM